MKILLTVHQFPPEFISGTEVLTFSVAKDLMRRGHEVRVLTGAPAKGPLRDVERFDEYEIEGIRVYRFSHAFVPMGDQNVIMEMEYTNSLVARYFQSLLSTFQPDLVHIFHMSRLGTAIIDVATGMKIPTYFTPTDFWSACPTSLLMLDDGSPCKGPAAAGGNCVKHVAMRARWSWIAKAAKIAPDFVADGVITLARKGWLPPSMPFRGEIAALSSRYSYVISRLNALNGIISPTNLMTTALTRNGVRPELIRQHMFGINIDTYNDVVRSRVPGKSLTFGFIGGLSSHKGCDVLIKAFKLLGRGDVRLKIFGNPNDSPAYYEELQSLAAGLDSIEFCGTFPNGKIAEVLTGIDTLVVPSVWFENAPLVIHSALAARCPVVASDFPGMSEVVRNGENGLLFVPGNPESLAAALRRLLDEQNLLRDLSASCRPPKSIGEYVDEIVTIYDSPPVREGGRGIVDFRSYAPLDPSKEASFIAGWCVADAAQPALLEIRAAGQLVAQTRQFMSRPDVRSGLGESGLSVSGDRFGFSLSFPAGVDRADLSIDCTSQSGSVQTLSLGQLAIGNMVKLDEGFYIGLDQECFS